MTAHRRDGQESAISAWLRNNSDLDSRIRFLSITDMDAIIHQFVSRDERREHPSGYDSMMLVEIKCFGRNCEYAQSDTLDLLDQLLKLATVRAGGVRLIRKLRDNRQGVGAGSVRRVRCFGVHLLQLSGEDPDKSDQIWWNRQRLAGVSMLNEILRFERDPDNPGSRLDTRRHHLVPRRERQPPLFPSSQP